METLRDYVNWGLTHCDKTGSAEGVPLVMDDCVKNKKMKQFEVYGESVQNGTPSPEAPVEVESVGELVTDVNDTNYGKYKIPIIINGNEYSVIYLNEPLRKIGDYADYIDFNGKKVVRKIYENVLHSSNNTYGAVNTGTMTGIRIQYIKDNIGKVLPTESGLQVSYYTLCNMYPVVTAGKRGDRTVSGSTSNMNCIDIIDLNYPTVSDWKTHLQELFDAGTPLKLIHALRTPYEEPIECELPTLPAKTSVVEIDTSLLPSNVKGKYIKR